MKKRNVFWVIALALLVGWLVNEAGMLSRWETAVISLLAPSPAGVRVRVESVQPVQPQRIDMSGVTFIGGVNETRLTVTPVLIDLRDYDLDGVLPVVEAQAGAMPNERHEKKERPAVTERSD